MRALVAVLVLTLAVPAAATPAYDLEWTSFARLAHWEGDRVVTTSRTLSGRASATLEPTAVGGVVRLRFRGTDGSGAGLLGPDGPMAFDFPTPLPVGSPPPEPHLSGGTFDYEGPRDRPTRFTITYVEGFICRATPTTCQGVSMWERSFEGHAVRR